MSSAVLAVIALCTTILLIPAAFVLLRHYGVLDVPSARSSHGTPTIRGGGLAPAAACLLAISLSSLSLTHKLALCLVAGCFGALGMSDDLVGVPTSVRLLLQALLTGGFLPLILWGLHVRVLWQAVIFVATFVWLIGFVNVFNFMDGINGIALAQALVAGLTWWGLGIGDHLETLAIGGAVVAGASLGFLPFNFPRAAMFLGDVGSYFLGAWLAVGIIVALRAGIPPEAALAPLALFVADAGWTLAGRVHRGERWHEPHRSHTYQRLVQLGWSHTRTTAFAAGLIATCSALGAVSLTGWVFPRVVADFATVALLVAYLRSPSLASRRRTKLSVAVPR